MAQINTLTPALEKLMKSLMGEQAAADMVAEIKELQKKGPKEMEKLAHKQMREGKWYRND